MANLSALQFEPRANSITAVAGRTSGDICVRRCERYSGTRQGLISFPISFVSLTLWFSGNFVRPAFSVFALPVLIWMLVLPILVIWFFYRMIRGLIRASENRPY